MDLDLAQFWKNIVDTLQDGLLVVDPHGNILALNPAAERLTGYRAAELTGLSCRVLNCTGCQILGDGRADAEPWCSLFAEGQVHAKRCLITNRQGRGVHVVKNAVVLRSAQGEVLGAVETLTDMSELVRQQQEIAMLRSTCQLEQGFHGLLGDSAPMRRLYELIGSVAGTDAPVLIQGESGTGKELVARAIHEASARRQGPFVKVNCAALNENLLETELFGHVRGAYTGADRNRVGRFEAAHGGTILLDEIGDIPPSTQVKLLRVLEEREIERVGDHRAIAVDVRVITATHHNLEALIRQGRFRQDLFFRIGVFPIACPPLSERREDIPVIAASFIQRRRQRSDCAIEGLSATALERLTQYPWPGNVRELRNAIDYACVLAAGPWIEERHLPPKIVAGEDGGGAVAAGLEALDDSGQRQVLVEALRRSRGNRSEAARLLGVSRVTLWKWIKKHGVDLRPEVR